MDNILSVISNLYPAYHFFNLKNSLEQASEIIPYSLLIILENILIGNNASSFASTILQQWIDSKAPIHAPVKPSMIALHELDGILATLDLAEVYQINNKFQPTFTNIILNIPDSNEYTYHNVPEYQRLLAWATGQFNLRCASWAESLMQLAAITYLETSHIAQVIHSNIVVSTVNNTAALGGLAILHLPSRNLEAKAAMFKQHIALDIPEIIGIKLPKLLPNQELLRVIAAIIEQLKTESLQGKIIEFFGYGLTDISTPARMFLAQQIANLSARACFFPADEHTMHFLQAKGAANIDLTRHYLKAQGLWHDPRLEKQYTKVIDIDVTKVSLLKVEPNIEQEAVEVFEQLHQPLQQKHGSPSIWQEDNSYISLTPNLSSLISRSLQDITKAKILAIFGDAVSTDQIIPTGAIDIDSIAGRYLATLGISPADTYELRLGNQKLLMQVAFTGNNLVSEFSSKSEPEVLIESLYEVAMKYKETNTSLIIFAGKNYGCGQAKEWAARTAALLGVRAIIAESFDDAHRSHLVSAGIIPFTFIAGLTRHDLNLQGDELIDIWGLEYQLAPKQKVVCSIVHKHGLVQQIDLVLEARNETEIQYLKSLGMLPYILRTL